MTEELDSTCENLTSIMHDLRSLSFELSSPILKELGFERAVKHLLHDYIESEHGFQVEYLDDGQGCDSQPQVHPDGQSGFGPFSIHERVEQRGGHLQFESQPGLGCKISLEIPAHWPTSIAEHKATGKTPTHVKRA